MKCHWIKQNGQRYFIPYCWSKVIYGDNALCTCDEGANEGKGGKKEMRKCKCEFYERETKTRITTNGVFHQWAPAYNEFESGPGNYTVGLIELPGGRIIEALPTDVRFLEEATLVDEFSERRWVV